MKVFGLNLVFILVILSKLSLALDRDEFEEVFGVSLSDDSSLDEEDSYDSDDEGENDEYDSDSSEYSSCSSSDSSTTNSNSNIFENINPSDKKEKKCSKSKSYIMIVKDAYAKFNDVKHQNDVNFKGAKQGILMSQQKSTFYSQ